MPSIGEAAGGNRFSWFVGKIKVVLQLAESSVDCVGFERMKNEKIILGDHRRRGRRLVPPLLEAMRDKYQPYSWVREILPEFVWLHFLFEEHGLKNGVALASKVALAANEVHNGDKIPSFAQISAYSGFTGEQESRILQNIPASSLEEISDALMPLSIICPDNPLAFLTSPNNQDTRPATAFSKMLAKLYDRHGREASWCNATAFYISAIHGKIKLADHVADRAKEALENIHEYPNTEESKAAGAFFRAGSPMYLFGLEADKSHSAWLEKFWGSVAGMGPCIGPADFEPDLLPEDPLGRLIFSYRNALRLEMSTRIQVWGFDLNSIEKFEVIGALLARQTTLATELAASPNMWTPHCAPVILRAMADVHIAVAWILGDPDVRSKKFVDDGLGSKPNQLLELKRGS